MSSVRVQVINDIIAEGQERFDLALDVPSSLGPAIVAAGRDTAVGIINDSTSKYIVMYIANQQLCDKIYSKPLVIFAF